MTTSNVSTTYTETSLNAVMPTINLITPEFMVRLILYIIVVQQRFSKSFSTRKIFLLLILDPKNSSITYEVLGEYSEMMYDESGAVQYRVWQYGGDRAGVRYPRTWTKYFCRPAVYLTSKTGTYSFLYQILLINEFTVNFRHLVQFGSLQSSTGHGYYGCCARDVSVASQGVQVPF